MNSRGEGIRGTLASWLTALVGECLTCIPERSQASLCLVSIKQRTEESAVTVLQVYSMAPSLLFFFHHEFHRSGCFFVKTNGIPFRGR